MSHEPGLEAKSPSASFDSMYSLVSSRFRIKDAFVDPRGTPTFVVDSLGKDGFKELAGTLSHDGFLPILRREGGTFVLRIVTKPQLKPPRRILNLILFVATIGTVVLSGYLIWRGSPVRLLVSPEADPFLWAGSFALALLSIIGLHELGHKVAANFHKLDATLPYFIPGPPIIGTFGAVISLRSPPSNRDQLFDIGVSGPLVGFLVTVLVVVATFFTGIPITQQQAASLELISIGETTPWGSDASPFLFILLARVLDNLFPSNTLLVGPPHLFFAAQVGAILTFLNMLPIWQLDGGHITRAVFGPRGLKAGTFVGLGILLVSGYLPFAILLLLLISLNPRGFSGVEPLDDVSPLSNSRKLVYFTALLVLMLSFVRSPF